MWTGDFLYYYCENAAKVTMEAYLAGDITINEANEMINVITSDERIYKDYQIGFDIYIPNNTVAFCDNFVIPKDSAHTELAHKFINFMIGRNEGINETDAGFANTYYVSYNTPYLDIYDDIVDLKSLVINNELEEEFKSERQDGVDPYDSTLFWNFYDIAIGIAFEKYYPKQLEVVQPDGSIRHYKGDILATFERSYINTINATFNNARA
jgi:spermidine/putrescine-binding protein